MLIAQEAGSESAKAPEHGTFDVALVVVHGMGNAFKSQILLEWAEPILERMDWVARDRIIGADETHGVTIHDSDLSGDVPMVTATVRFPKRRDPSGTGCPGRDRRAQGRDPRGALVGVVRADDARAGVPLGGPVHVAGDHAHARPVPEHDGGALRGSRSCTTSALRGTRSCSLGTINFLVDVIRLIVSTRRVRRRLAVPGAPGRGAHADPPAAQPAAAHPVVQGRRAGRARRARRVDRRRRLVEGAPGPRVGDAARRARRARRAKELVGDGDVHLFAHSQGAAVATFALFEELEPSEFNVRRLTTVGAAVVLLGREKWQGRKDTYTPVEDVDRAEPRRGPRGARRVVESLGDLGSVLGRAHRRHEATRRASAGRPPTSPSAETVAARARGACRAQHEPAVARPRRLLREHRAGRGTHRAAPARARLPHRLGTRRLHPQPARRHRQEVARAQHDRRARHRGDPARPVRRLRVLRLARARRSRTGSGG